MTLSPTYAADRRSGEGENTAPRSGNERTRSAARLKIPRIDVDTASREKLIAHIDELTWRLEDASPRFADVTDSRRIFGMTAQEALVFGALLSGRLCTPAHLRNVAARWNDEINDRISFVLVCRIRRKIKAFGASITTVWGQGFIIEPSDLAAFRSILDGEG